MSNVIFIVICICIFILSCIFEARELYYSSKYQRPDRDEEGCLYKKLDSNANGMVLASCKNKFYNKIFHNNGEKCPPRCKGQTYKDCIDNFETMTRTDKLFICKKLLGMISSILGIILTILNIIDKF